MHPALCRSPELPPPYRWCGARRQPDIAADVGAERARIARLPPHPGQRAQYRAKHPPGTQFFDQILQYLCGNRPRTGLILCHFMFPAAWGRTGSLGKGGPRRNLVADRKAVRGRSPARVQSGSVAGMSGRDLPRSASASAGERFRAPNAMRRANTGPRSGGGRICHVTPPLLRCRFAAKCHSLRARPSPRP